MLRIKYILISDEAISPRIAIFQPSESCNRITRVCELYGAAEQHQGNDIVLVKWDLRGRHLASVDRSGKTVIWGMQVALNLYLAYMASLIMGIANL